MRPARPSHLAKSLSLADAAISAAEAECVQYLRLPITGRRLLHSSLTGAIPQDIVWFRHYQDSPKPSARYLTLRVNSPAYFSVGRVPIEEI